MQDCASLEFTDRSKPTESAKPEVIPLGPARAPVQFDLNTINSKLNTQSKAVLPGTNALTNRPILSSLRAYEDRVQSTRGKNSYQAALIESTWISISRAIESVEQPDSCACAASLYSISVLDP